MNFVLALSLLTVSTSAASFHPSNKKAAASKAAAAPGKAAATAAPAEDFSSSPRVNINDLLNKIKIGVGKGLAGSEGGSDAFDAIFKHDFAKIFGDEPIPKAEEIAKLKEMLGTDAAFKSILDSDVQNKLFPEALVESFFKHGETEQLSEDSAAAAHTQIDETFAEILNVPVEKIKKNREKAMAQLATIEDKSGFDWNSIFTGDFNNFMNVEL